MPPERCARLSLVSLLHSTSCLSQTEALQLSRLSPRQRRYEFDLSRILVGGDLGLDEILELLDERAPRLVPGTQHHECLHNVAALGVGNTDNSALQDRRVIQQRVLTWPES